MNSLRKDNRGYQLPELPREDFSQKSANSQESLPFSPNVDFLGYLHAISCKFYTGCNKMSHYDRSLRMVNT